MSPPRPRCSSKSDHDGSSYLLDSSSLSTFDQSPTKPDKRPHGMNPRHNNPRHNMDRWSVPSDSMDLTSEELPPMFPTRRESSDENIQSSPQDMFEDLELTPPTMPNRRLSLNDDPMHTVYKGLGCCDTQPAPTTCPNKQSYSLLNWLLNLKSGRS
jgi:hypothetical protein